MSVTESSETIGAPEFDPRNVYSISEYLLAGVRNILTSNDELGSAAYNYRGRDEADKRLASLRDRNVPLDRIRLAISMVYRDHGAVVARADAFEGEPRNFLARLEEEFRR